MTKDSTSHHENGERSTQGGATSPYWDGSWFAWSLLAVIDGERTSGIGTGHLERYEEVNVMCYAERHTTLEKETPASAKTQNPLVREK